MNTRLNKKVKKDLDAYFKGFRGSDPEVHHGLKHILIGALTDANFHSEAKQVQNMFPKANQSKYAGRKDWEDSIEQNHGVPIAKAAKWDGYEIIDAISFFASMFIGGPVGAKITSLKEGMNENVKMFVSRFIKEVNHSHEYEDMSQMGEDENDPQEISVGNYQTKYFHVCPGASNLYKDIESKGVDMDMAERSARLQDALYFVEEHIQRDGYKPERDYVMVAKNIAKNIMKMAEMMGLEKEHDYIQGHVDTIEKVVKEKGLEERVMELTEENVPTNPSKWSYYKSQAKKKFDVYPSAYANAWAAKQYKDAGGGWRTKKSEATSAEEDEFHKKLDKLVHSTFGKSSDEKKNESVNEAASRTAMEIGGLTGMNKDAIQKFVDSNELDIEKVFQFVKKGKLKDRMDLVSAIAGKPNNPIQKKMITMFKESVVNEAKSEKDFKLGTPVVFDGDSGEVVSNPKHQRVWTPSGRTMVGKGVKGIMKYGSNSFFVPDWSKTKQFNESVNEGKEPDVISQLRDIVSKKQNQKLKDPKSGKKMRVDLYSASAVTQVYDALKQQSNKDKFVSMGLVGMVNMAFKLINKQEIVEYDVETLEELNEFHQFMKEYKADINEAEYQGRKVKLGKPMQGDVKKFKVYVKNDKGNVVKVNFGAKGMNIKKNNPERRKSFRARHNCDNPGPRWKARYWSCRKW